MCQKFLTDFFMAYMSPLGRGRFARLHVRFSAFICAALVIVDLFLDICDIILNYITNPLSLSFDEKNLLLAVYLFPVGFAIMRVLKGKASKKSLLKYAYPANLCLSCVNVQQAVRKESRRKKSRKSEQSQDKYMQAIQATQEANRKLHEVLKVEIFGEAMPQLFLRLYFAIRCAFRVGVLPDWMTWIRVAFSSFSICGELYNLQTLRDQCYCIKRLREVDVPDSSSDAPGDQQKALLAGDLRPYRHNLLSYIAIVALSVPYCLVQTTVWALVLNSSSTLFYSCLVLHGGIFWTLKFYFSLPGEIPWSEHPMPVLASLRYIFSPYSPDFHVEVAKENSSVARQHIIFLLFSAVVSSAMLFLGLIIQALSKQSFPPGTWITDVPFITGSSVVTFVVLWVISVSYVKAESTFRPPETTPRVTPVESDVTNVMPQRKENSSVEVELPSPSSSLNTLPNEASTCEGGAQPADVEQGIDTNISADFKQASSDSRPNIVPTLELTEGHYSGTDESDDDSATDHQETLKPDHAGAPAAVAAVPYEHSLQGLAESLRRRNPGGNKKFSS